MIKKIVAMFIFMTVTSSLFAYNRAWWHDVGGKCNGALHFRNNISADLFYQQLKSQHPEVTPAEALDDYRQLRSSAVDYINWKCRV